MVEKTRNNGTLTEAGFNSLITSALRKANQWWKPRQECLRKARVSKGQYLCSCCNSIVPATIAGVYKTGKKKGQKKRIKNIHADHRNPVVDPYTGFISWDVYIERMFIEEGWDAICHSCHSIKSAGEASIRAERKRKQAEDMRWSEEEIKGIMALSKRPILDFNNTGIKLMTEEEKRLAIIEGGLAPLRVGELHDNN